jgi:propionate CoA-transferase
VFSGTFTAGGLQIATTDGKLRILQEGRSRKFVRSVEQICYNGRFAREQGREAVFVTERAVFRVGAGGLELCEVAPGIDIERDIVAHMDFRPAIAADLKTMDARLFAAEPMGLKRDILVGGSQARQPRRLLAAKESTRKPEGVAEPA